MAFPQLHIINLPHRLDRRTSVLNELQQQDITNFKIWNGIIDPVKTAAISRSHKQIIRYAQTERWDSVTIAEDDIQFTAPGAFRYFCQQCPAEYDLYLGAISYGKIDQNNKVSNFSGLLFYRVHERFYERFLSAPEEEHIDRALRGKGIFKVCPAFVVIELNGVSDNSGKEEDNTIYYASRQLFGRLPIPVE